MKSEGPPPPSAGRPVSSESDHLDSWKEIAAYLRREVRTLQRWEKQENLPVHRHQHDSLGSVYAYKSELDAWRRRRQMHPQTESSARKNSQTATPPRSLRPQTESGKIRLLVLPFENLSGDAAQDFFSDGLTEEMIAQLGRLDPRRLAVIGRTTAMHYKGSNKRIDQIGDELGVDYMLEGSVRRSADRVRITAKLVRAKYQTHLWAETYDRDVRDVLALQSEVAQSIAREIRIALPAREQARLVHPRPLNPQAWEAYLKGRWLWYKRTTAALRKSLEYFQQAIQKESSYALAWAGLADAYCLLAIIPWDGLAPNEAMPRARAAARKALEIDDSLAEAYTSLAMVLHRYEWDWPGAERNYRRAIELNPNNSRPHLWYAWLLMTSGRREESALELKEAEEVSRRIDPLGLVDIRATMANSVYLAGQYDRAIADCHKGFQLSPNYFMLHYVLGQSYLQKGLHAEAIRIFEKAVVACEGNLLLVAALGHACGVAGRSVRAQKVLDELQGLQKRRFVPSSYPAIVCAGMGDRDQAFLWLEKSYQERSDGLTYLSVEPWFDSLRSDPRFQDLLRRVNAPGKRGSGPPAR